MTDSMRRPRLERAVRWTALMLACGIAPPSARADPDAVHGRIELQEAALYTPSDSIYASAGPRDGDDSLANLRLIWEPTWDRWGFSLHDVVTVEDGLIARDARAEAALLPAPPATLLNLTKTFEQGDQTLGTQQIDRLALSYTAPDFVLRIGRQALSWGSGFVFRPMDLIRSVRAQCHRYRI